MEAVILAGGLGTRLREETEVKPKPMVEIGGMPILWHIMQSFSAYGVNEFLLCVGYKSSAIVDFFVDFVKNHNNVKIEMSNGNFSLLQRNPAIPNWTIKIIHTGMDTPTGGRLKMTKDFINGSNFFCTYGDGLSDVNLDELHNFHATQDRIATVTAVRPLGRFGKLELEGNQVTSFDEKPKMKDWINGGFFCFKKEVFNFLSEDSVLEKEPLQSLAIQGQLSAFHHEGFWQPMDTYREMKLLNDLWRSGEAPWAKSWRLN